MAWVFIDSVGFPLSVILSDKTPRCGCFGVELSKICNELLIFESQNAAERFEDLCTVRTRFIVNVLGEAIKCKFG